MHRFATEPDVGMHVDQARHDHAVPGVDDLGLWTGHLRDIGFVTHRHDLSVADRESLRPGLGGVEGVNGRTADNEIGGPNFSKRHVLLSFPASPPRAEPHT
ncbi:hypothetical protein [Streptomyces sp. R08]|uniref:Uncharacterized protein n=1 Tax=Streptomyces sp. R08 TaxID=3238624 RepID=A0AB39MNK2_9ACTN